MAERVERFEKPEEFEFVGFRLSWGAIFAGLVIAVVTQIILTLVGLAIGLGTVEFGPDVSFEQIGFGAGIWAVLTGLISLFVGGLATGHLAGVLTRGDGVLHGILVWGLSVIVALWALSTGVTTLLGGMFGVAGQALAAAVSGAGTVGAAAVSERGVPRPQEGESQVVAILEQQGMSRQQAQETARVIQDLQQQVQLQAEQVRREAPQAAEQVAGGVSTAIWWILLGAILSLAAAAGGAALTATD